jgi:polygalacturonase
MSLTKVTYSMINAPVFNVADFGAIGDGVADDTSAWQTAINTINTGGGGQLIAEPNKTYLVGTLEPKAGVYIDLSGSTLKLKNASGGPLFYDNRISGAVLAGFGISNGTLNCNRANNNTTNITGGTVWMTNWDDLYFDNLTATEAYRNIFNFYGCQRVIMTNIYCLDNGVATNIRFSYGATFDQSVDLRNSAFIDIRNFLVDGMWGFGMHFVKCAHFNVENAFFNDLTYDYSGSGEAIAITITEASYGTISNVVCNAIDSHGLEVNASRDITIDNYSLQAMGGAAAVIFGDNGIGVTNYRVITRNLRTVNTVGSFSLRINWMQHCAFENLNLDKAIDTTTSGGAANDRGNVFRDTVVGANISLPWTYYKKFNLERVSFSNFYVNYFDGYTAKVSNPLSSGNAYLSLAGSAVTYVNFEAFNIMGSAGFVTGDLKVVSMFAGSTATQSTYTSVPFLGSNNNTTFNLGTPVTINNATPRPVTIAGDAANRRISITNPSADNFLVKWSADLQITAI